MFFLVHLSGQFMFHLSYIYTYINLLTSLPSGKIVKIIKNILPGHQAWWNFLELHEDSIYKGWAIGRRTLSTRGVNCFALQFHLQEDLFS